MMNLIIELDLEGNRRVRLELRGEVLTITGYKKFSIPLAELNRALGLLRGNTAPAPAPFQPSEPVVHRGQVRRMSSRWGMKAKKADPEEIVVEEVATNGDE